MNHPYSTVQMKKLYHLHVTPSQHVDIYLLVTISLLKVLEFPIKHCHQSQFDVLLDFTVIIKEFISSFKSLKIGWLVFNSEHLINS